MGKMKLSIGLSGADLGKFKIEGEGFDGEECVNTLDELQDILGVQTVENEDKPERVLRVTENKQLN